MMGRPLRIAFMGYSALQTNIFFKQFAHDNREQIKHCSSRDGIIIMKDGTLIEKVNHPSDGKRFDQYILADDSRRMIYGKRYDEISWLRHCCACSKIPHEFHEQFYDIDVVKTEKEDKM